MRPAPPPVGSPEGASEPRGVVYVVAKAPTPGAAKTRLCPPLTPEHAASLASAFLQDALATVAEAGLTRRVICRNAAERDILQSLVDPAVHFDVQNGGSLGDALESAFQRGLADGYAAVAVLGADSPTLPAAVLREGFGVLLRPNCAADVAFGPSEDGGYYFLAARALHPTLFRDMPWSTSGVAETTLARCLAAGLRTHILPTWYDVDDAAALDRLDQHLAALPAHVAPHTRLALRDLTLVTA